MKTVLITGIGKGIGKALAAKFLAEGHAVIGTVFSSSEAWQHGNLTTLELDLARSESIVSCTSEAVALDRTIDILINNAGVLHDEDETVLRTDLLRSSLEVNLVGTASLTERMLSLVERSGHILFVSSTAGSLELTGEGVSHYPGHYPAYKISKAALNMYMRTLAIRLAGEEIAVSSVHPGWVRTDMGGKEADISPEEAADAIYALAVSKPETGQFWFKGEKLPW